MSGDKKVLLENDFSGKLTPNMQIAVISLVSDVKKSKKRRMPKKWLSVRYG
jgi:hypothetical protein